MALTAIVLSMPFAATEISPRGWDSRPLGTALSLANDKADEAKALSLEQQVMASHASVDAVRAWTENETALEARRKSVANGDDQNLLRGAIAGYQRALSFYVGKDDTQNAGIVSANLLAAFLALKGPDAANIPGDEVRALAQSALAATDRQAEPLVWSRLQIEIGTLLLATGARANDLPAVESAVAAFRSGLENAQHDGRSPREWAEAENLLANALEFLGNSRGSEPRLREALKTLDNAWVLYQYAGLDQYQFFFEARIAALQARLAQPQSPQATGQTIPAATSNDTSTP